METNYFPVRKQYKPENYSNHTIHFFAAEGSLELLQDAIRSGANIYRPVREGETPLHVGIYNQQWNIVDALMDVYERHYLKVMNCLEQKGISKSEADIWLKKPISVACTDEECRRAKELENGVKGDLVELVLLKQSNEEECLATIVVTENNKSHVKAFTESLKSNGMLTWSYSGPEGNYDTFIQLAAFRGAVGLVKRLVANGVQPSIIGRNKMTPLMEACSSLRMDVIRLLFEEYTDLCDPVAKDKNGYTAFLHIIPHSNAEGFDYVLHKTMAYRVRKFGESENEAFNQVFRYEGGPHWACLSIWSILDERFRSLFVVPYLNRYTYDLSFQYGDRIMLMELIIRNMAKNYYRAEIRQKPELLSLTDQDGCNVLHCLMWSDEFKFIQELYGSFPEKCRLLFECKGAVICLVSVLIEGHNKVLIFLLENHREYIETILENVFDNLFAEDILPESIFGEPFDIILLNFPELEPRAAELHYKIMKEGMDSDEEFDEEYDRGLTHRMLGM